MNKNLAIALVSASAASFALAQTEFQFSGINSSVFAPGGQSFVQSGVVLSGWTVNVQAAFSDPSYAAPFTLTNTNISGAPFVNPFFPTSTGVFFRYLPDTFNGANLTLTFNFDFQWTGGGSAPALDLTVFAAESVDFETDTLVTNGGNWQSLATQNLGSIAGTGTQTATISATNQPGVGSYTLQTNYVAAAPSRTVAWTYDYTRTTPGFSGAQMLGFSTVVPEPSTYAAIAGVLALGLAIWRRRS